MTVVDKPGYGYWADYVNSIAKEPVPATQPGYGGWEDVGTMLADVRDGQPTSSIPQPLPRSPEVLKAIRKARFPSNNAMQRFLGCGYGTLEMVLSSSRRVSVKTAKKWAKRLESPEFLEAVIDDFLNEKQGPDTHKHRWATSMDIETYRNLYNFYQKALRSGVSAPGDVHHEMGKIYRRLKKAGEVG